MIGSFQIYRPRVQRTWNSTIWRWYNFKRYVQYTNLNNTVDCQSLPEKKKAQTIHLSTLQVPFLLPTPVCFSVPIPRSIFFYLSNFHTISLPVSLKSNFFSPPLSLPRPFNPDFPLSLLLDYTYISDIADGVIRSIDRPLGYQVRKDRDEVWERERLYIWRGGMMRRDGKGSYSMDF